MILQIALNDNRYMKPIVRIKGYEKDWISCLLSDCLTICNEKNHQLQYGKKDALSVSDEYGVVNQIQHLGRSYAGKDVSGYKILRKNQIVYTKSPLKQKPYGIIKVNDNEDGIVSVLYAVYDTKNGICPDFLNRYFEPYGRINKYLIPIINKGAKNTINVSDAQALQGRINIPVSEDEQKAIAGFFSDLDKLIVASTNRVSSLRKMKAASLQAMFPQKGETRPRVRFKGFEDEYSSMTANELFKTFDERNHPELPVLSAAAKPSPISKPLTAPIDITAFARLASSFSNTGSPTPGIIPVTTHSIIPPTESFSCIFSPAYFSTLAAASLSGILNALLSRSFISNLS